MILEPRYHVPRSQVWAGSRGAQHGNVHLHVTVGYEHGRIRRLRGQALCGRAGWYERPPEGADELVREAVCARCLELAERDGSLVMGLPVGGVSG